MSLPGSLLLITSRAIAHRPLLEIIQAALAEGCRWVLVREKDLAPPDLAHLLKAISTAAAPHAATISISGASQPAGIGAQLGLHLPQGLSMPEARRRCGPHTLIGVSAHSQREAQIAAAQGADYVTLSPIFASDSKPGYGPALGLARLQRIAKALPIPLIALGGIDQANARACLDAGAAGVAVMGGIMRAADPAAATREVIRALQRQLY